MKDFVMSEWQCLCLGEQTKTDSGLINGQKCHGRTAGKPRTRRISFKSCCQLFWPRDVAGQGNPARTNADGEKEKSGRRGVAGCARGHRARNYYQINFINIGRLRGWALRGSHEVVRVWNRVSFKATPGLPPRPEAAAVQWNCQK